MAESGMFKYWMVSILLIGMFIVSMMLFGIGFVSEYGLGSEAIVSDLVLSNVTDLNNTLFTSQANVQGAETAFLGQELEEDNALGLAISKPFRYVKTIYNTVKILSNIIVSIISSTFTLPIYVTSTILAIIGLTIVLAIWRLLRTGD